MKSLKSKRYQSPGINDDGHRTKSHNRLNPEVMLSMKVLQSTMTGPNNRSSMIAVESGLSKELSGTIKSSNDLKSKDNLAQIKEDEKERHESIPHLRNLASAGNYESIKKDNEI